MLHTKNSTNNELVKKLIHTINWDKKLPQNIFFSSDYIFLFFERPIIDNKYLLEKLLQYNDHFYSTDSFLSFGLPKSDRYAQYFFDEIDPALRIKSLQKNYKDYYWREYGYPILLTNKNIDWIIFESASEELGVFAVKDDQNQANEFINLFEEDTFISCEQLKTSFPRYPLLYSLYGNLIPILRRNYCA